MKRNRSKVFLACVLSAVAGCGGEGLDEGETIGEIESALENANALNPNALNPNALNPNALNPNALGPSALAAIQHPDGEDARALVKYTVGCALDSTQSFSFSWTDAGGTEHPTVYRGLLGLAPEWSTSPISAEKRRWISACLASRSNYYQVSVTISSRGPHTKLKTVDSAERAAFNVREGAFFGDAFADSPALYACYEPSTVDHAHLLSRECASGHPNGEGGTTECGPIHVIGPCAAACIWSSAGFYESCRPAPGGASYGEVITTFLP